MSHSRQLAAIMFTDIVGYTALMGEDEEKAMQLLDHNRVLQKPLIQKYRGKYLKEMGDGILASFNSAGDAVNCALAIQKALSDNQDLTLRIGIHSGDTTFKDEDIFGDSVNIAARIQSIADPGGIYITDSVHQAVRGQSDIQSEYLGKVELKNVDYLVRIFAIKADGLPTPTKTFKKIASELEKSILVLPFTNLSPDPDDNYFSDGLTEELITDLSRISKLRVISSSSSFRLKGTGIEVRTIGQELQVQYVVTGRVRKAGQQVRITAQLIDVRDDTPVWADKYLGSLEKVFDLQEQVSRAIADALQVRLNPPSSAPRSEAVEAYLKGRHFFRQATSDGLQKALVFFQAAADVDPTYAPAFAGLAYTYTQLTAAWNALPANETMPKAKNAAERAIELDPTLPEVHRALGLVATYNWELTTAENAFQMALQLNPNYAEAHGWYTTPLIWLDTRFTEAIGHAKRAVKLNPVDPWALLQLAWALFFSRDFEGAITESRQLINIEPLWGMGHYFLGTSLAIQGNVVEAADCINRAIDLDGRTVQNVAWLGLTNAIASREVEAHECLTELEAYEREGRSVWAWKLVVYAGLNNSEAVMQCLDDAFQERSASLLYHLTHPLVDSVRMHPRFTDLLGRMNLRHLATYKPESPWQPNNKIVKQ